MYIPNSKKPRSLSEQEIIHIEFSTECELEREKLIILRHSANKIDLISPPKKVWSQIDHSKISGNKIKNRKQILISLAASFFLVVFGWLITSNYYLQRQIDEVLLTNQYLEFQIQQDQKPYMNRALLKRIQGLEYQLVNADSDNLKLEILMKRTELMTRIVTHRKGNTHEYSI